MRLTVAIHRPPTCGPIAPELSARGTRKTQLSSINAARARQRQHYRNGSELRPPCSYCSLIRNLRFNQTRQMSKRVLPSQITKFQWNHVRHTFLRDVELGSTRDLL